MVDGIKNYCNVNEKHCDESKQQKIVEIKFERKTVELKKVEVKRMERNKVQK